MLNTIDNNSKDAEVDRQADELRAQGVWLLGQVIFVTWLFFGAYYTYIDHKLAASCCGAQCVAYLVVFFSMRSLKQYCIIMNLFLGFSLLGVLTIAIFDPASATSIYFAPYATLVASQLFGSRQGRYWLVYSMLTMTAFFEIKYGFDNVFSNSEYLTQYTLAMGMCASIFLVCRQFESHYKQKTQSLVSFSESLEIKSDELRKLATTDSLTNLANRFQLKQQLEESVENAKRGDPFAIFLIDMDGFKEINDSMGHAVGDQVLVEIGKRLSSKFGNLKSVARLGGDEFCLIATGVDSEIEAQKIAKSIYSELTKRYFLEEHEFGLEASVGLALCPSQSASSTDILAFADTAMYHAKHNQLAIASYSLDMTRKLIENRKLKELLADAITNDEFFLVFQPQICLSTGNIVGVEALLRWNNQGNIISPDRFIPLLEQTGRIVDVGQWVIEEACRQRKQWLDAGVNLPVAVNISAVQFDSDNFIESIVEPIERWGLDFEGFDLEITESLLIGDVETAVNKLTRLKSHGVSISIDDFGTGYSSLAYLRQFPIDKLKIDRAFVKDIPDNDDGAIISSITMLGHVLGMKVLVEGVETKQQLEVVKSFECDECQGFYFNKPLISEEITSLIQNQKQQQSTSVYPTASLSVDLSVVN